MQSKKYRLFIIGIICLFSIATVFAKNVKLSNWVTNISEGAGAKTPGYKDRVPRMVVEGSTVHMIWAADSAYKKRFIFYRKSTDGGESWESKQELFSDARNDVKFNSEEWQIAVSGTNVHVLVPGRGWGDTWYGTLHHIRSTNGGQSFSEPKVIVTAAEAYHVTDVFADYDGDFLTIGYRIQYNAAADNTYYIKRSSDNGDTFQEKIVYSTDSGSEWEIWDVLVDGENIYVLYSEQYYMYGLQRRELYLSASNNEGDTFQKTTLSFPSADGDHKAMFLQDDNYVPKIASNGDDLYIVFCAYNENDEKHIYLAHSADKGQTFNQAKNLTEGKMPEGYDIYQAYETISVKNNYVNIVFFCDNYALFTIHSNNSGNSFEDPKQLLDKDSDSIGKGAWPSLVSGNNNEDFYIFYSWPSLAYSNDGGKDYSIPVMMSPHFSIFGEPGSNNIYPQMQIDNNGDIHLAFCGYFLYSSVYDYDIFYRKYETNPMANNPDKNQALSLDYNDDNRIYDNMQVIQNTFDMSNSFTLEIYVKPSAEAPEKLKIVSKDMYSGFILGTKSYQPYFEFETDNNDIYLEAESEISNQVWTHLSVTYDKDSETNNMKLYVNGNLSDSADASGALKAKDGYLIIGNIDFKGAFSGLFDEFRIWNRALEKNKIQAKMREELTGQENGLEAYFDFNGSCKDKTGNGNDGVLMYSETFVSSDFQTNVADQELHKFDFRLEQNYPNPFNPVTNIKYSLPKASHVKINIYDINGKLVEELINVKQEEGHHLMQWKAGQYSSGVYLYRIITPNYTSTKKCILMK